MTSAKRDLPTACRWPRYRVGRRLSIFRRVRPTLIKAGGRAGPEPKPGRPGLGPSRCGRGRARLVCRAEDYCRSDPRAEVDAGRDSRLRDHGAHRCSCRWRASRRRSIVRCLRFPRPAPGHDLCRSAQTLAGNTGSQRGGRALSRPGWPNIPSCFRTDTCSAWELGSVGCELVVINPCRGVPGRLTGAALEVYGARYGKGTGRRRSVIDGWQDARRGCMTYRGYHESSSPLDKLVWEQRTKTRNELNACLSARYQIGQRPGPGDDGDGRDPARLRQTLLAKKARRAYETGPLMPSWITLACRLPGAEVPLSVRKLLGTGCSGRL